jgi:ribosomal protein L12E/L44/L45/RPP1/RPP2
MIQFPSTLKVIIAKASAKAAQTTVAQMALRQTQQDQELQEQMKYEEEEKERQLGPIQLAAQTAQQRLSKMSHETIPRQDSSENDSDDFNCQKSESKSRITPFRSVSHSTRGKSVDELLANHGREMDTLVHSMASPPASQRVVDFGKFNFYDKLFSYLSIIKCLFLLSISRLINRFVVGQSFD